MSQSSSEDSRILDSTGPRGQDEALSGVADGLAASFAPNSPLQTQAGLSAILNSIGDAVLVTNAQGRVMLLNPVAERLTGWSNAEAFGVDSRLVFDIVNEETRQISENPIDRVLQRGVVVGLANHTILRRRDGTKIAIDNNGAPVRDDSGALVGVVLVFHDISQRREIESTLTVIAERLQIATASARIGTWDLDPVADTLFWDAQCRAAFGYPLDLPIDYPTCLSLIHPDDREHTDAAVAAALSPSGTGQYAVEYRTIGYLDGVERWVRVEGQALFNEDHTQALRFVGTIRDITTAKRGEQALHEARLRLDAALLAGNIATWTLDIVHDRVFADANLARLFSISPQAAQGRNLEAYLNNIHPADRAHVLAIINQAIAHSNSYEAEYRVALPDGSDRWLVARGTIERDAEGTPTTLLGVVLDITERVQREQRELFLAEIAQQTYGLTDPQTVIASVVAMVGAFLKVDRCQFAQIDMKADLATIHEEYCSSEAVTSIIGTLTFSAFGYYVVSECEAGRIVAVDDVRNDPVRVPPDTLDAYLSIGVAAHIAVPAIYGGALVGVLAVHSMVPRRWQSEDVELLRTVVERMWLTVENARLNRETKLRAERESLLNQVGAAVRATLDPEEILHSTVSLLGQGLHADRCYFVRVDPARNTSRVSPEWYRADAGLRPLAGRIFQNLTYATHRDPAYSITRTHVLHDAGEYGPEEAASFHTVHIRSRIRVPIEIGGQMAALSVAMAYTARHWTADEVRLVENVAVLVRSALEAAHTQQRERNIAQQLQDALIPPPPTDLPGLTIRGHYKPALEEASVGGDFYDVFPLEAGKTALVVGDLSGKGLKAASEVATVRNMVRFALYADTNLARAITTLDRILVERNLLTGFATMFVGVYDETRRTLSYVNCGQEPALLWRAETKAMDMLPPTGPVLGGFESAGGFEQSQIPLMTGDVFAIFTDGLTDAGPNRKAHLNIEGVGALFQECCKNFSVPVSSAAEADEIEISDTAQAVVDHLINTVDSYSKGGIRDDISLLVGILATPAA